MKHLIAVLMMAWMTVGQAEVTTYTDRETFEDALPVLKIVHERFKAAKKWGDTFQSSPFVLPDTVGPITRGRVSWGTPDKCVRTLDTDGRGNAFVASPAPCGTPITPTASYQVAAKGGRLICAFGADFRTGAGISNAVLLTLDGVDMNPDDEVKLDHAYQFVGFINTDCGSVLIVSAGKDEGDGLYNFQTRDAIVGRTE